MHTRFKMLNAYKMIKGRQIDKNWKCIHKLVGTQKYWPENIRKTEIQEETNA